MKVIFGGWKKITLQGTNISPKKWHFEDDFPIPKVGYVNSLEGIPPKTMTKHLPTTKPRLEKRRQKQHLKDLSNPLDVQEYLAVLERFQSIRAHWWWWGIGLSICGWHGVPLMLRVWWLFSHVFTWFFFGGGWSFLYPNKCMICFFPNRIEEDQAPSLPWWGCSCYKGVHVHMWVDVSVYLHISSCILSLYIFSCQLLA